jgi:hypothetical protein
MVKTGEPRTVRRWIARLALAVVAAVAGSLVIASPALAEGENPNAPSSGCTAPETVREFVAQKTGIRIELRYSYNCQGAWTRSTQPGNNRYGTTIFLESNDGARWSHQLGNDSQEWTGKANWWRTLRACYGWGYEGGAWNNFDSFECTSWW